MRDELVSQGAFYGMAARGRATRADELIESLDLAELATARSARSRGGQKRRLDVALGLMHAPPLLFLDEPSTGLDPQSRANLWQHILDLREQHGTTIFLTTHYLEEADRYAERVMVMDHGRVIADDTATRLKAALAGDVLTLGFADEADADARGRRRAALTDRDVAARRTRRRPSDRAATATRCCPPWCGRWTPRASASPAATGVPPTLDDVFLALTGRSLREAGRGRARREARPTHRASRPTACRASVTTGAQR